MYVVTVYKAPVETQPLQQLAKLVSSYLCFAYLLCSLASYWYSGKLSLSLSLSLVMPCGLFQV